MTEFKQNTFDPDDMAAVLSEYEEGDADAEEIMAEARGRVSGIRKRQKELLRRAKDELGIPTHVSRPLLRQRKLERQLRSNAADVPEEWSEVFEEASGQFSLFAPADDEPAKEEEPAAKKAARQRRKKAEADQQAEQEEGAAVLDGLVN